MAKPPPIHQIGHYQCKKCKLKYTDQAWAEKCEAWCKKYKSCNIEIITHAIVNTDNVNEK
ncbi:hypothetical protein HY967_05070 [Candidatus Jorgensenbacteria bacterium]|nr:hypothetical protein [Candidatus Jorgensenbacteria bacterium]